MAGGKRGQWKRANGISVQLLDNRIDFMRGDSFDSSKKCLIASGTLPSARFRSRRFICWLPFAADFIRRFSASHSCDTTVRLHSSAACKTLRSSDQHPGMHAPASHLAGLIPPLRINRTVAWRRGAAK